MSYRLTTLAALLLAIGAAAPAAAQYYDPVEAFRRGEDPLSQQMRGAQGAIVQQNMDDPQVMGMYQEYVDAGSPSGYMTPEQFAYEYARQGGFTPEGRRRAFAAQQDVNARTQQQNRGYWNHQERLRQQRQEGYDREGWVQGERGRIMQGTQSWYDQDSGTCWALAYTEAGEPYQGQVPCPGGS